ncbi:Methylmalonyl-CoA epimerase [Candidatus Desulfarcum epimagneticum]|uniref:Methylmalonyl-CoA epimerase n=1 Tax=uncultured Desulfobacteraceae bacterium TaxID=218296 RepID=A0A484HG23_9BACT|nr:Methylmalonyl-CoA epimerase [uncultured Desulfobacteraceae bacterium]
MKAKKIDHICIAVKNLSQAREIYENTLGLDLAAEYVAESEKIKVARYYLGEVALELMESTTPDGDVARFIEKKGEGVFLISYLVDDVDDALGELREKGEKTIDEKPRELMGNRYAFIMPPTRTCGVLTEIIEGDFNPGK